MKMLKLALLGGAALAVTAAGARADDLGALKAEIEALNARVAQLETAPAVPAGYQLMSLSSGAATVVPGNPEVGSDRNRFGSQVSEVTKISVLPTADAPAAATIEWSGYVRAIIGYHNHRGEFTTASRTVDGGVTEVNVVKDKFHSTDLTARGQLKVIAKTDTAVGEVGVRFNIRGDLDGVGGGDGSSKNAYFHEAWGWWAMTPELTLGGGYSGSLGNVGYGYDGACTCYGTDNADVAFNPGDTSQMRLTWTTGPFSIAAAVEDGTSSGAGDFKNEFGAAGQIKYSGDAFNAAIDGVWRNGNGTFFDNTGVLRDAADNYQFGGGVGFTLDPVSVSLGAAVGRRSDDVRYWGVSGLASVNLSDAVHAEVGAGYKHKDSGQGNTWAVLAGIYYAPVKQLTIGIEAEYTDTRKIREPLDRDGRDLKVNDTFVDLVTVFSF